MLTCQHIIGFAGGSCSGKSYLCKQLQEQLSLAKSIILPMDCYYRDLSNIQISERHKCNFDIPTAIDHELFIEHLGILKSGDQINLPNYNFHTHTREKSIQTLNAKGKIVLVEGLFTLYWENVRKYLDLNVFINSDPQRALNRRILRDTKERGRSIKNIQKQFKKTVIPMYCDYIAPTQKHADIIFHDHDPVGISIKRILKILYKKTDNARVQQKLFTFEAAGSIGKNVAPNI